MTEPGDSQQRRRYADMAGPVEQVARAAGQLDAEGDSEEEQQRWTEAAAVFAHAVAAGDGKTEVQAFIAALNLADALQTTPAADRGQALGNLTRAAGLATHLAAPTAGRARAAVPARPPSIFDDPVYLQNARKLIADPANRRVGGVGATATEQYPDCVAVGSSTEFCCSGTLIAPRVVVTAGHCHAKGCSVRVFTGPDVTDVSGEVVSVQRAVPHPEFDPDTYINDLTVLILEEPVEGVTPGAIAPPEAIDSADRFRLVGYGATNAAGTVGLGRRRMVTVPRASDDPAFGAHQGLEFVAGAPFLDRDSCKGDSGGPAYVRSQGQFFLAGVTSRATASAQRVCGDGGIYVRVDKYTAFVREVAGNLLNP